MREMLETILGKYGSEMTIRRKAGDVAVRCFFQPVSSTSWQSITPGASVLGQGCKAEYLCVAPAGTGIREDDVLLVADRTFVARRVELYRYSGEGIYQWALCVEKGGEDRWGI